ncbi:MAG: SpoIIE family protein phosphatase [Planctomycetota bacterium]|jgi:serine phosphatase RsbU (regulator of sigma subunit)
MKRSTSIRASLLRDLSILVLLLGAGTFAATFVGARQAVRRLSESLMGQTLKLMEARLDGFFGEVQQQLAAAQQQAERGAFDLGDDRTAAGTGEAHLAALRAHRNRMLAPIIERSPQISSVMLADGAGREHMLLLSNQIWRNRCAGPELDGDVSWLEWTGEEPPAEQREVSDYDPRRQPWYREAVRVGDGSVRWTEPQRLHTTQEPGITLAATFDRGDGVERVLAVDVLLNDISEFTRRLRVSDRGIAAILTEDRRVVGLPGLPVFDEPDARSAAYLQRSADIDLTLIEDAVAAVDAAPDPTVLTLRFASGGEAWWLRAAPYALSPDHRLRIAIVIPESDLLGDIVRLRAIILLVVGIVLAAGVVRAIAVARRFSRPIEAIVEQSERITAGDLEPGAPIDSPIREIRRLVEAQDHMRQGIAARIRLEKVERDLSLAREIQRGLLPANAPDVAGFEIAGWNQAADETGGDFYDWLELPDGRIVMTLADVTGHGVGPALIVAVYRAYMRASTTFGESQLNDALAHVNDLLHADIPADRFITAVVAVLQPDTGEMDMLSAGHAPLLYYEASSGTVLTWDADAVPLGIVEGMSYETPRRFTFAAGDMLVLLTDGFFEWANAEGEQFGIRRLEAFVRDHQQLPAEELIQALHHAVLEHAGGTEQGDDLTMVVVRRTT